MKNTRGRYIRGREKELIFLCVNNAHDDRHYYLLLDMLANKKRKQHDSFHFSHQPSLFGKISHLCVAGFIKIPILRWFIQQNEA